MIKNNVAQKSEKLTGDNFSAEKYFYNVLEGMPFTFNRKKERLRDVKNVIKKIEQNNDVNSSEHVDILIGNYELFINIGKYVDKIDKNITQTISAQKKYSNLLSNLRKDIEELTILIAPLEICPPSSLIISEEASFKEFCKNPKSSANLEDKSVITAEILLKNKIN